MNINKLLNKLYRYALKKYAYRHVSILLGYVFIHSDYSYNTNVTVSLSSNRHNPGYPALAVIVKFSHDYDWHGHRKENIHVVVDHYHYSIDNDLWHSLPRDAQRQIAFLRRSD